MNAASPPPGLPRVKVHVGGTDGLEKPALKLGIVALTDCAPIVVAREKGFFRRHGLEVTLSREPSWANIRDKVSIGVLDGAQMLAGMPLASSLGIGGPPQPMVTAFSMDLNGNGITVSEALYRRMCEAEPGAMAQRPTSAAALKKVVDADRAAGRPPMRFATVFPVSGHNYELRYWMAAAGIDPDRDVQLVVIPPVQMVDSLSAGEIVGYCVGEPWNQRAIEIGAGRSVITSYELWNNKPEKVFGVLGEWAERHPNTHRAVLCALIEAARWLDEPEHREEAARIVAAAPYVDAPASLVAHSMTGTWRYAGAEVPVAMPDFNVFYRYAATFPWRSHAIWFMTQMLRWGQIEVPVRLRDVAEAVYRSDLYRDAAGRLGVPVPAIDYKREGEHGLPWMLAEASAPIAMGPDRFFDGRAFDPADPLRYLAQSPISRLRVSLAELAAANA